jgi:LruC domain-containing protein
MRTPRLVKHLLAPASGVLFGVASLCDPTPAHAADLTPEAYFLSSTNPYYGTGSKYGVSCTGLACTRKAVSSTCPATNPGCIPSSLVSTIISFLPEGVSVPNTKPSAIGPEYNPNLVITATTKILVSLLYANAGYDSALGYFTYTVNTDGSITVNDRALVFPHASGGGRPAPNGSCPMSTGDTVALRDPANLDDERIFQPGQAIGFFLVSNGWSGSSSYAALGSVTGWDESAPALPYENPADNESSGYLTRGVGVASGVVTSVDALNPENAEGQPSLARHAIVTRFDDISGGVDGKQYWVMSFEDMIRTHGSDNDFNDCVFQIESWVDAPATTPSAWTAPTQDDTPVSTSQVCSVDAQKPDPDDDGVSGLTDGWPNDATRAFVNTTPVAGVDTIVFEDTYPYFGDMDYNDAVIQYTVQRVTSAGSMGAVTDAAPHGFRAGTPLLKDILGTYSIVARGAYYDHSFGLAIDGFSAPRAGSIQQETYAADGTLTLGQSRMLVTDTSSSSADYVARADGTYSLVLDGLIPDDKAVMPQPNANTGTVANTVSPTSARFLVTFSVDEYGNGISDDIGEPPWDPYIRVNRENGESNIDIHLPGSWPLPGRPAWLPDETNDGARSSESFFEGNGWPYALVIPASFQWAREGVNIETGGAGLSAPYPRFQAWRQSSGASDATWYDTPTATSPPCVTTGYTGNLTGRQFTLNP